MSTGTTTFSPFRARGFHLIANSRTASHCAWKDLSKYTLMQAMKNGSLRKAESRVYTYYGLEGTGANTLEIQLFYDQPLGLLEYIEKTTRNGQLHLILGIDMVDFFPPNRLSYFNMDRVFGHEMVHALMHINASQYLGCPLWFIEGQAELLHGANHRLKKDLQTLTPYDLLQTLDITSYTHVNAAYLYSSGYVAVRYLHDLLKPVGIIAIINQLKNGQTFNQALAATTSFTTESSFRSTMKQSYGRGVYYLNQIIASGQLDHPDTGAIGGYWVDQGPILVNETVMELEL